MRTLRCSHCHNGQIKKPIYKSPLCVVDNDGSIPPKIPKSYYTEEICMYCLGSSMIFEDK